MDTKEKAVFITATKICSWGGGPGSCCSCGSTFEPDVVYEEGKPISYWVSMCWTEHGKPTPDDFCWGCASLFMVGDYRGGATAYQLDLPEFADAVYRAARNLKRHALNPQESDHPALAVELIDRRLEEVHKLEAARVVTGRTFDLECRDPYNYRLVW